jgi:CheY-like chemotaxis protein
MNTLLVFNTPDSGAQTRSVLEENGIQTTMAESGQKAVDMIKEKPFHLVIIQDNLPDTNAKQLIEEIVQLNPMMACAVQSTISKKAFHDLYEGLGVLMQLPEKPVSADIKVLLNHINKIIELEATIKKGRSGKIME